MKQLEKLQHRIQRDSTRLDILRTREIHLAQQAAMRTQDRIRRKIYKQRKRWAELVVLSGADHLDDAQLVAALLRAAEDSRNPALREEARLTGEAYLQRRPLPPHLT
ncbi:hypothetical protein [Lysobacter enzymogenes]|uniref:hypothetical protein n=1 Tax=Lysobacter enzymogenes TaxID=69 RepID=UPI000F4C5690|nr:hypothetical protein [Lysobacter enzymogenes]